MARDGTSLAELYEGWGTYQRHLVAAIAPLSVEQLALRAAPHLRTIERIASHIIGARVRWFHRVMGEGDPGIAPLAAWDRRGRPPRTAAELVRGLEASWGLIQGCLERWTLSDLYHAYEGDPAQGEPASLTRRWIIWHVLEHDLHHGGEISLSLGMHRLAAPDL